ncbi:MAG: hypothetical protein ACOC35_00865 [Promethearchaeia archaeon]
MVEDLSELYKEGRIIGKANYVFNPEVSSRIGSVHGSMFNQNESLVMGRDYHSDSRMLKRGYTSGFMSSGTNLLNLSDSTFPLVQFTIRRFGASGGIYFSGGHSENVRASFIDAVGIEVDPHEVKKIIESYNSYPEGARRVEPNDIGSITAIPQTEEVYIKSLQQFVDKKKIQDAKLKVVVDCSYGPAGEIAPLLLNELGVEVIALNTHFRKKAKVPVPNVSTIKNTAEIVKASNSHFGVCFDVDGSRVLVIDENGLEKSFEELLMLFISFDPRIQKSKGNTILTTPQISNIAKNYIEESGYPVKTVENLPGEISRQIREERACFAAADTFKFYFPQFAPFSDGCFILLKLLEIMTREDDLLSSLTRGFPKGIKINRTVNVSQSVFKNFHIRIRKICDEKDIKYRDIINDIKIIGDNAYTTIKLSLNRKAIFLSAESDDTAAAKEQIQNIEQIIRDME